MRAQIEALVAGPRRPILRWIWRLCLAGSALLLLVVALVVAFWCAALLRESADRVASAPHTGRFIQSAGLSIFVQEEGPSDGPAVLFVHGTGAWSEIWHPTMRTLAAEGYHCIALDLPPFGFSERPNPACYTITAQADRIIGVMDALKLTPVTLVGHSFGARPTVEAALRDTSRIKCLVLVDAALGLNEVASNSDSNTSLVSFVLSITCIRDPIVATTLTNPALTHRLLSQMILDPSDATAAQVAMVQRQFQIEGTTHDMGEWLQQFMAPQQASRCSDRALYALLTMPTLLVWGRQDELTPLSEGESLRSDIPQSELGILEHTGHIPHIESEAEFNATLLRFLQAHR